MRVTEIDGDTGVLSNLSVLRHLTPLVIGHALPCRQQHTIQHSAKALHGEGGSRIVHLRQDQVAAFELHERTDG